MEYWIIIQAVNDSLFTLVTNYIVTVILAGIMSLVFDFTLKFQYKMKRNVCFSA